MASHPGPCTVEAYVDEAWHNITAEQKKFIIETYESNQELKEYIEMKMRDFEEEEQSWRDYRNAVASAIDDSWPEEYAKIKEYIK